MTRIASPLPALLLALSLTLAGPARADPLVDAAVAAECGLLEQAYAATRASGVEPLPDILVGCPGRERMRQTMKKGETNRIFALAARSPLPEAAAAQGKSGKIIFQRMIARGVPVPVAEEMTGTAAFRAAVEAAQKL